jgi:uncharacterized membrane protein YkvA (DUF1232 family)
MEWWQGLLLAFLIALVVAAAAYLLVWRPASARARSLARRVRGLPSRERLRLARELAADGRLPPLARIALAGVVLYLGLTFDLVPDFIPVLGQIDDAIVLVLGAGLMIRRNRLELVEAHLAAIEASLPRPAGQEPPAGGGSSSPTSHFDANRLARGR